MRRHTLKRREIDSWLSIFNPLMMEEARVVTYFFLGAFHEIRINVILEAISNHLGQGKTSLMPHCDNIYLTVSAWNPWPIFAGLGYFWKQCISQGPNKVDGYCRVQVVGHYQPSEDIWLIFGQDCHQPPVHSSLPFLYETKNSPKLQQKRFHL